MTRKKKAAGGGGGEKDVSSRTGGSSHHRHYHHHHSSNGRKRRSSVFLLLLPLGMTLVLCILVEQVTTAAGSSEMGSCWRLRKKDGSCGHIQRILVTREDCCSGVQRRGWSSVSSRSYNASSSPSVSSSSHSFSPSSSHSSSSSSSTSSSSSSSALNSVISEQPKCSPCSMLCEGVKCGEDRKCVVRCGAPRCVCSPQCHLKHKEPVCGSDGRTYSSECHLLKRACRKKKRVLVAHYGPCQTCSGVRCRGDKQCVLDEQMTPICIKCPLSCPRTDKRPLCAADGRTYTSRCQLKQASCLAGSLIPRAYMGSCRDSPTCDTVRCWGNQTCLTSVETGQPQCTECNAHSCRPSSRPVCASDGRTYPSWCAFRHEACRSGRALTPALHQHCASNHTKADDCRPSKGGGGGSAKRTRKHRTRQQELEAHQKEFMLQQQDLLIEMHQADMLTAGNMDVPAMAEVAIEDENPSTMEGGGGEGEGGGGGGGSGLTLPEETQKVRNKHKSNKRKRKKCKKSRKRRRKDRRTRRIKGEEKEEEEEEEEEGTERVATIQKKN